MAITPAFSSAPVDSFVLPDLIGRSRFPLTVHPAGEEINAQAIKWLLDGCPELNEKQRRAITRSKTGLLGSYTWPRADAKRLRVVSDYIVYLFHFDDVAESLDSVEQLGDLVLNALWFPERYRPTRCPGKEQPVDEPSVSRLTRDFWGRMIKEAGSGPQARFKELKNKYLEAVSHEVSDTHEGSVPDVESYIELRRDTGACKAIYALIEYAMGLDLPEHVITHPVIEALTNTTTDIISWENDILSYNAEQSRGTTYNLVAVLMINLGCGLQEAVDRAADLCQQVEVQFFELEARLPSWGPEIDRDVRVYVQGLRDWIAGSLHWSFVTTRYFGEEGSQVKEARIVKLLPKRGMQAD